MKATRDSQPEYSQGNRHLGQYASPPVVIATIFREFGTTGVHTHFQQVRSCLQEIGAAVDVVTPFSWARPLTYPVFAPRTALLLVNPAASVVWYRHWHELFLRNALRRTLAPLGNCVIYAQGPLEARAALSARTNAGQRVIMAVHFRTSQADEYAEPGRELRRGDRLFHAIRNAEANIIPQVDGIVYVTRWARDALLSWLPEAASVPSTVISNFVAPLPDEAQEDADSGMLADVVTTGRLDDRKNHRFILDVLAAARDIGHRYTLDIYGDGPDRKKIQSRISELGLTNQVHLRGFRSDVRKFLPRYRVYAHAAYAESSSLAIIEAMAVGLPIIAGGIGPIAELLDDGTEGRYWPLDNPVKSASILSEILESDSIRTAAGEAAKERFRRDYDAKVAGSRIRKFLLSETPLTE